MRAYMLGLSRLCAEVAGTPALLPVFLQVLRLVPVTIARFDRQLKRSVG
jgi:hypothetical protein